MPSCVLMNLVSALTWSGYREWGLRDGGCPCGVLCCAASCMVWTGQGVSLPPRAVQSLSQPLRASSQDAAVHEPLFSSSFCRIPMSPAGTARGAEQRLRCFGDKGQQRSLHRRLQRPCRRCSRPTGKSAERKVSCGLTLGNVDLSPSGKRVGALLALLAIMRRPALEL